MGDAPAPAPAERHSRPRLRQAMRALRDGVRSRGAWYPWAGRHRGATGAHARTSAVVRDLRVSRASTHYCRAGRMLRGTAIPYVEPGHALAGIAAHARYMTTTLITGGNRSL